MMGKSNGLIQKIVLLIAILAIWFPGPLRVNAQLTKNHRVSKEERLKWWLDARFGMMIHWGAYAQTGGFWKGVYEGGYSEWLKFRQIPNVQYDSLIREFNPVGFNAEEWVRIARDAGMKYIVFTAKHHDGFAMYDSKITDYDIVDMTGFGRDPVGELAAACQKAGLKFGVYYSVDRDWHHPDAACDDHYQQCNFWDYPNNKSGGMDRWHNNYFPNFALKQVEELVTRYPIDIVWFDGIGLKTRHEVALLDSIIHTNRPDCLINSRISNFFGSTDGDYGSKGDNETPGGYQAGGWENPGTLGFSYGYSAQDSFMSPEKAIHNLIEIVSKGGNYLLNVGPDGKGIIIPQATGILKEMGSWLNIYGSSIYGSDGLPLDPPENIRLTVKPHKLFVHVLNWTGGVIKINGLDQVQGKKPVKVHDVYMLSDIQRRPLKYQFEDGILTIDLASCLIPASRLNPHAEVIVVSDGDAATGMASPYPEWKYSGSMFILTTPEGAGLHVSASEKNFPLLVRMNRDFFDFSQAKPAGEDIRFATVSGKPLAYQVEEWNPVNGTAAVWVKIPEIRGNTRQEIKVYWGNPEAKNESDGSAVFGLDNGYLTVMHMNRPLTDETGTVFPKNSGATETAGVSGSAMHFEEGQGISCGENINAYPTGSNPSTTEAWVKGAMPNGLIMGWGNEEKTGKVTMSFASPPHIRMDCYWSGANVSGGSRLPLNQWIHVVHTCKDGNSRVYLNGRLDAVSSLVKNPLTIKSPAGMWIGGWKDEYWFSGDMDEVRISNVARSDDWIRLQYENQKPLQTLVGPLVQPGDSFSVSIPKIEIAEGKSQIIKARAGGALKVYWIIKRAGAESVIAADQLSYTFDAGRVVADQSFEILFKAVYPEEVKTATIPVTVKEDIPEPIFTLRAPPAWNGREVIEVIPRISNLAAMKAKGADQFHYTWTVTGGAVIRQEVPGKLLLNRSQFSGKLTVKLAIHNGGTAYESSSDITVTEPETDPWVQRMPGKNEKPVNHQFYARDDQNEGTLHYNGKLGRSADSVFLRIFANEKPYTRQAQKVKTGLEYGFTIKLKPGLVLYKLEFGTIKRGREEVLDIVSDIVCGDAYVIDGQSNAEANDYGRAVNPYTSDFLRSFGCADTDPQKCRLSRWGDAVSFDNQGAKLQIGYWGIELGKKLIEDNKIPVCIINGSVGGSRIDVHQRNEADPTDSTTIYGRLLWRIRQAGLTHGIRGVLWHQGENDQGAAGPTGRFGWEDYQQYFIDLSAAWKQDYPNIQHYYIFQIWPRSCAMTENGSDNMLREVQRSLPRYYSNMGIMSTLGIKPPGGCHFPPEGYAEIAHLICPLVQRDNYGRVFSRSITPPDLQKAYYTNDYRDEIALEFDQAVVWKDSLVSQFYLDGQVGQIDSGSASGKVIRLKLKSQSEAMNITYLDSKTWSQDNILWGENGIAALTFCSVVITLPVKTDPVGIGFNPEIKSLKQIETPEWFQVTRHGTQMRIQ